MKENQSLFKFSILCVLLFVGCNRNNKCSSNWSGKHLNSIAQNVSKDVCKASQANSGEHCNAVFIFEENHGSVAGQIEQAIALVRLHKYYGLSDIALEAYLKNDENINIDWFIDATKGDIISKISVAVNLIKEGEINAAEFLKLVYNNIIIHKTEKESEYYVELGDGANSAPVDFLYKIALLTIADDDYSKFERRSMEYEKAQESKDENEINKNATELLEFVINSNEWTSEKYKMLNDEQNISLANSVKLYNEIDKKAKEQVKNLTSEDINRMADLIAFNSARDKASYTIMESVMKIPQFSSDSLIALIIGAGHTQVICCEFSNANVPFIVMTPLSYFNKENTGFLDNRTSYKRKMKCKSVFNDSYIKILDNIIYKEPRPVLKGFNKKPGPVLNEAWFQAKTEIYFFVDKITRSLLGSPNLPIGENPSFGLKEGEFKGKWIWIDPNKIAIINDKISGENSEAVLFELTIYSEDRQKQTRLWVKSGLNKLQISGDEEQDIEKMLFNALNEVKKVKTLSSQVRDSKGRIKVSIKSFAAIASSQNEVIRTSLNAF